MPSRRFKAREAKKNAVAILIVVAFAAVVFSVNSIGRFIAQKLISPLAQAGTSKTQTVSFNIEETTIYALGLALDKKEDVASLDGATVELNENVLFSCYIEKPEAEQLAQKHSLLVIPLYADKLSVRLTGNSEQIDSIKNGMNLLRSVLLDALEVSASLDRADVTRTQAKAKAQISLKNLQDALNNIPSSENETVKQLKLTLECYVTAFSTLEDTQSDSFLKSFKILSCELAREYLSFASAID